MARPGLASTGTSSDVTAFRFSAELRRGDFHLVLDDNEFVVCVVQRNHQPRRRRTRLANGRQTGSAASPHRLADVPAPEGPPLPLHAHPHVSVPLNAPAPPTHQPPPPHDPINVHSSSGMVEGLDQGSWKLERWGEGADSGSGSGEHPRAGRRILQHGSSGVAPMGCRACCTRGRENVLPTASVDAVVAD
jgi:hypothetical protein